MLQNAHLVAKIGTDTTENERNFAKNWQLPYGSTDRDRAAAAAARRASARSRRTSPPRRTATRPRPAASQSCSYSITLTYALEDRNNISIFFLADSSTAIGRLDLARMISFRSRPKQPYIGGFRFLIVFFAHDFLLMRPREVLWSQRALWVSASLRQR